MSWIMTLVPSGPSGVLLKSNLPSSCSYADNLGLIRDVRNKLSVISACGGSLVHRCKGKSGSVPHRIAMKWFFHVRIDVSAALRRCKCAGVFW